MTQSLVGDDGFGFMKWSAAVASLGVTAGSLDVDAGDAMVDDALNHDEPVRPGADPFKPEHHPPQPPSPTLSPHDIIDGGHGATEPTHAFSHDIVNDRLGDIYRSVSKIIEAMATFDSRTGATSQFPNATRAETESTLFAPAA